MATNVVTQPIDDSGDDDSSGGKSPRALPSSSSNKGGFFTIYKRGQGYWTRMGTVGGAALIALLTLVFIYQQLPVALNGVFSPGSTTSMTGDQIRVANEHAHDMVMRTTYAVCVLFLAGFSLLVFWLMNKPTNADFLIATDSEMKKVNWTSREELIGSTKVVIGFMFLIAFLLFALDVAFGFFFYLITVLKTGPFG